MPTMRRNNSSGPPKTDSSSNPSHLGSQHDEPRTASGSEAGTSATSVAKSDAGSTVDPAPARHEVTIETRRGKKGFGPAVRIQLERGDGARASSPSGGEHRERARISPCPTIHLGETGQKIAWLQDTGMIYASLLVLSIVYPH